MTIAPTIAAQPKNKVWHNQSAEDVLTQLGSSATGLSAQEAAQRLAADGPNEIKEGKRISPLQIFLGQFKSILIWILIPVRPIQSGVFPFIRISTSSLWLSFHSISRCGANTTRHQAACSRHQLYRSPMDFCFSL